MEGKRFPYCRINDERHNNTLHKQGKCKFISKFPRDEVKASEIISRAKKKSQSCKEFCVPTYLLFEVSFPDKAVSEYSGLKRKYQGKLAQVRKDLYEALGEKRSDVTGNNVIFSSFLSLFENNFSEYLKDIEIIMSYELNDDGMPKDKCEISKWEDEKNEKGENMETFKEVVGHLKNDKNVIVEGVAGSGKSYLLKELRKKGEYGDMVNV